MIVEARSRFADTGGVDFEVGDVQSLRFDDASFDVVLCLGVLEYVPDLDRAFDEVARVLRPGGVFVFSMLNRWSPYRIADDLFRTNSQPCRVFSTRHANRLLARHALARDNCSFYDFNLLIAPLDHRLPRLARTLQQKLGILGGTPLRWVGTAFVMKASAESGPLL
jgi:SAM-dependent methyltransferase